MRARLNRIRLSMESKNAVHGRVADAEHRCDLVVREPLSASANDGLSKLGGYRRHDLVEIMRERSMQPVSALARYDVQAGDLLFARSGATLGKVCVAPANVKGWRMTGHILRVRLDPRVIRADVASQWLWASAAVKEQITSTIRGGTRPGYNTSLLESIVLPIPPLEEQIRIVAKVEHLMKICDDLEANLRKAEDRAAKLVEAVVQELVA